MKIGFIGLGRMGRAMVLHLLKREVEVVVYNRTREKTQELISNVKSQMSNPQLKTKNYSYLYPSYSVNELISKLEKPRIIWLMVEAGKPVDEMIEKLLQAGLESDDILLDGGNSFYKDSIRRYQYLKEKTINFLDIGTSGGLQGARNGACLMVGGEEAVYKKIEPLLKLIAQNDGYAYFGTSGAGHYIKMIHNGVEYGMLQAIGEGFALLQSAPYDINLQQVAKNWNKGSVVRGWLMELLARALRKDPRLSTIEGKVGGGETGEWTLSVSEDQGIATPTILAAVEQRKKSQTKPTFAGKVIQALRWEFGKHEVKKK